MKIERQRRDWEDLAAEDLYWSILSDPDKRFEAHARDAFFASGRSEIDAVFGRAATFGLPSTRANVLDFGCGAGRLTRALAGLFEQAVGVDISARMIEEARAINRDCPNCSFEVNEASHLHRFEDSSFDAVYTSIVLQHMADPALIQAYLAEFVRILRPGGLLAFQLPSHLPLRNRLQPRRRVYRALRLLGVPRPTLFRRLRLQPIAMQAVPAQTVRATLESHGAVVVAADSLRVGGVISVTYFATIPSSSAASSAASTARE